MFHKVLAVCAFVGFAAAAYDVNMWTTDQKYYLANRMHKQSEAFLACSRRGDLRLVEIDSAKKNSEVKEFLYKQEFSAAWTAGKTGPCPFRDYIWGGTGSSVTYTNWVKKPDVDGDISEQEWHESGIIVTSSPLGKWDLIHEDQMYPALCEHL